MFLETQSVPIAKFFRRAKGLRHEKCSQAAAAFAGAAAWKRDRRDDEAERHPGPSGRVSSIRAG
jgi:hypothetical protein